MSNITFIDRETGNLIEEKPPGESFLKFIYGNNPLGKFSLHFMLKRKLASSLFGWYMGLQRSAGSIQHFVEKHNISLEEYVIPEGGFKTFNDFFYRKINILQFFHQRQLQHFVLFAVQKIIIFFSFLFLTFPP